MMRSLLTALWGLTVIGVAVAWLVSPEFRHWLHTALQGDPVLLMAVVGSAVFYMGWASASIWERRGGGA